MWVFHTICVKCTAAMGKSRVPGEGVVVLRISTSAVSYNRIKTATSTEQFSTAMVSFVGTARVLLTFIGVLTPFTLVVAASTTGKFVGYSASRQRSMPMISPLGRRRYRSRTRRRYRDERRPSHPTTIDMYDHSKHFLDDQNWMIDKKIRIWDPRYHSRKRANERSWSGRLTLANIVCYGIQTFNPKFTQWGIKLSERILTGKDLYRLITPVFLHGGLYQ